MCLSLWLLILTGGAHAEPTGRELLSQARELEARGKHFSAARRAFAAQEADRETEPEAYSLIASNLSQARLYNSASYFFIRALQSQAPVARKSVLRHSEDLILRLGADLLRKYLARHTQVDDYDRSSRAAYLYAMGKEALLTGEPEKALSYLNALSEDSPLAAFALQLKGTANAILGRDQAAIHDFSICADIAVDQGANLAASSISDEQASDAAWRADREKEAADLSARCLAGVARVHFQSNRFVEADRAWDKIPKASLVWTDTLFEQAWNAFAQGEYNRALGKLVSYKSPALRFVFNSEIDVLRAQSYLALCLYADAGQVIDEFHARYSKVGEEAREFAEKATSLTEFHEAGKQALADSLLTGNDLHRLMNRFVRGPYFQNLVASERLLSGELSAVDRFASMGGGQPGKGFGGFLEQVLKWRLKTIRALGGAFVKNSLIDYHSALIADFERVAFVKLEMLSRSKEKLLGRTGQAERTRGDRAPSRRSDQYFWSFNGEFWNDELGDYVFGLESECGS